MYEVQNPTPTKVMFAWSEAGATKTATREYGARPGTEDSSWTIDAGRDVKTLWVEYAGTR